MSSPDILRNGGAEEHRLLPHNTDLLPQPAYVDVLQVHAVQANRKLIYIYIILYKHNITVKWYGQKTVLCLCMFISCFSPFLVDQLYWHQILLTSIRDHNVQLYLFLVKIWFQQVNSARICNNLYTT